ncbi:MAG: PTS sugar transporter subunit IIA [Bacteroidales bacterium]|nr:PTS sugar transporter subunit IIA [Candidatus Latescibacterota bacterium]
MMLTDHIRLENIRVDLDAENKTEVIEELAEVLGESSPEYDSDAIYEAVMARERDGSTGLELGVAIPHAKCDAVTELSVVVGISKEGVDFDSQDGKPSHLFFMMIAPKTESGPHVQAIAKIVKMIKLDNFRSKLLKAREPQEVLDYMRKIEEGEI